MEAKILARTGKMSDEEWHKVRRLGIGGSDIAAIAGLSPYKNALGVYLDKIGANEEKEESEAMYFGKVLEPVVAQEFSSRSGKKVKRLNAVLQNPHNPFMLANLDRLVMDPDRGQGVLECKTSNGLSKSWKNTELPEEYVLQTQWYLGVTGLEYAWIAILLAGQKFLYECIERDDEIIGYLKEIGAAFWRMVENRTPPAIDGSEKCSELLQVLWNSPQPTEIILPDSEALPFVEQYLAADAVEKQAKESKTEARNNLANMLGNNETGYCTGYKVTWKKVNSTRLDTTLFKAEAPELYEKYSRSTESRPLFVRKAKE